MPASASASASSASRASSEMASETLTMVSSASVTSSTPSGSSRSPAWTRVPASAPSTDTVMNSGMSSTGAFTETVEVGTETTVSGPASPSRWMAMSTSTFSLRSTITKSTCSMIGLIGSRCTSLASTRRSSPEPHVRVIRALV